MLRLYVGSPRNLATSFLKGEKQTAFKPKPQDITLIIDEVDILFEDDFYGQLYYPASTISTKSAQDLVRNIWNNRARFSRGNARHHVEEIMRLACVRDLKVEYPKIKDLLSFHILEMLHDVKDFPVGRKPRHECICKNNNIGYADQATNSESFNTSYGYKTAFAFFV